MIAIIGGGIAGLTTALAFEKLGIDYKIFERNEVIKEVGAGIWLAPNALQVLDWLGVLNQIQSQGNEVLEITISDQKMKSISDSSQKSMKKKYGFSTIAIHRAKLQQILLDEVPVHKIGLGMAFSHCDFIENKPIKIHFESGQTFNADALIGADGIHSKVRNQIFPKSVIRHSGQTCWRGVCEFELEENFRNHAYEMWGGKWRFGFSNISAAKIYWFAVINEISEKEDDPNTLHEQLLDYFKTFHPKVNNLIRNTPVEQIIRNDIIDLKPMKTWHKGKICLIGDAGHATTPNMGQGGAQAIEDAYYLSNMISQNKNFEKAFEKLEAKRKKKVQSIVSQSWSIGKMAHWENLTNIRNLLLRSLPKSIFNKQLIKLYTIEKFDS